MLSSLTFFLSFAQLDGESWRSSQPRYAPKNAASLMTPGGLLTPEQASSADNVIAEDDQVSLQIKDFYNL